MSAILIAVVCLVYQDVYLAPVWCILKSNRNVGSMLVVVLTASTLTPKLKEAKFDINIPAKG